MFIRFFKFLLVLSCSLLLTATRSDAKPDLLFRRKQDMTDGGYTSPDGKFVVTSKTGDASDVYIAIREKKHSGKILFQSKAVAGFTWIPNKEHQLVFAIQSDNNGEKPGIFLWQPGQHSRIKLLKGINDRQDVEVYAVTPAGDRVIYRYWPDLTTWGDWKKFGPFIKSLNLP